MVKCRGASDMEMEIQGSVLGLQVIVVDEEVDGINIVVGMDMIT